MRLYDLAAGEGPARVVPESGGEVTTAREEGPGRWRVICRTSKPAMLRIGETFVRGWRATVSGRRARTWPADGAFLHVDLPPGDHEVDVWYDPVTFRIGLFLSVGILAALVGAAVVARR